MIDFHTGLGPSGYGEAIYAGNNDDELARVRRWYGSQVTSIYGGDSASAIVQGPLMNGVQDLLEDAEFTPLALEYGTLPISDVMNAMRAEQWLTLYGDVTSDEGRQIKQRMRDCFYVDTDTWKVAVFERALDLTKKGLTGLAG
jgi:cytochrome c553